MRGVKVCSGSKTNANFPFSSLFSKQEECRTNGSCEFYCQSGYVLKETEKGTVCESEHKETKPCP
jgi:hypothetical protein